MWVVCSHLPKQIDLADVFECVVVEVDELLRAEVERLLGPEMKKRTVHFCAQGQVQGVGYRAFVESNASQLNIDGWVRNRRNGSVEAVFRGSSDDVAELIERCRQGPAGASVTGIDVCEVNEDMGMGFVVLPTA